MQVARNKSTNMFPNMRAALNHALASQREGDESALVIEPISDALWETLEDRGYVGAFNRGGPAAARAFEEALQFIHDARGFLRAERAKARPQRRGRPSRRSRPTPRRSSRTKAMAVPGQHPRAYISTALSDLFVMDAVARDSTEGFGVMTFRRRHLRNKLLSLDQVEQWVADKRAEEPVSAGAAWRLLSYVRAGSTYVHHVPIKAGGVLDELREINERLTKFYGWSEGLAAAFILTGAYPRVALIRTTVSRRAPMAARSRIILTIHPFSTPQEVSEAYAEIRSVEYGRLRRVSPKHARLAMFAAEQPAERASRDQLQAWNRTCQKEDHAKGERGEQWGQDWSYPLTMKGIKSYARDARVAWRRLAELR
jgi:hypothetical protein